MHVCICLEPFGSFLVNILLFINKKKSVHMLGYVFVHRYICHSSLVYIHDCLLFNNYHSTECSPLLDVFL